MIKKLFILLLFVSLITQIAESQINYHNVFRQGEIELNNSEFSKALTTFNLLARQFSDKYEVFYMRSIAKNNLGDLLGAENDLNRAIKLNPYHWKLFYYRGVNKSQQTDFFGAIADFNLALEQEDREPDIYINRGIAQYSLNLYYKALEDFNKAIKLNNKLARPYYYKGITYFSLGEYENSILNYNQAISKNPFAHDFLWRRAMAYIVLKEPQSALKDLNLAIKFDSTETRYRFTRSKVYLSLNDTTSAFKEYNFILTHEPQNVLTYYYRANLHHQLQDFAAAELDYSMVISMQKQHILSYFNRGVVRIEQKKYRLAIEDYTKVIELYPNFANAYINRSVAKQQLGMKKSALTDYNQARILQNKENENNTEKFAKLVELPFDYNYNKYAIENNKISNSDLLLRLAPNFTFSLTTTNQRSPYFIKNIQTFIHQTNTELVKYEPILTINLNNYTNIDTSKLNLLIIEKELNSNSSLNNELKFAGILLKSFQKDYISALADLDYLIILEPKNPYYYFQRANTKAEMLRQINLYQNNISFNNFDIISEKQEIDYSEIHSDYDKVLDLQADYSFAHFNKANIFILENKNELAISEYQKAIELFPNFAEAYFNLALVFMQMNRKEEACLNLSKAGEKGIEIAYELIKDYCGK